jgi:hypothetical protein
MTFKEDWIRVGTGKLLLDLASRVILGSESRETHDHIVFCHDSGSRATPLVYCRMTNWMLNCCWSSPAEWFLVPSLYFNQSQRHITADGQSVSQSWCQAPSGAQYKIFITVRQLLFCRCGASSFKIGRVCHLARSLSESVLLYDWRFTADQFVLQVKV